MRSNPGSRPAGFLSVPRSPRAPWRALPAVLSVALICFALRAPGPALGGTLRVRVVEGSNSAPIAGAYVQVGPAPGVPFTQNWGFTDAQGLIVFSDSGLIGPQTVTSGYAGHAWLTVVSLVVDSIRLALHPQVVSSTLPPPKAQVHGTTSGIQTQNNDGNLDVGIVYPTVNLGDLLMQRTLPFEIPADTVNFPVVGPVVLPGNVVIPTQIEFIIFQFSKPNYHFYVPDNASYDFLVLAGRLPLSALSGNTVPFNQITMRQIGAERNIAVHGDRSLNLNCDLTLSHTLTVSVPEAPNGTTVMAASVADLPIGGVERSLFFDIKSALRDTLSAFHMSGMNPGGDMSDETPYLAGYYADSSSAQAFQAGRVDRTPLTLPATRTLGQFFLLPTLSQVGYDFRWTNVARPGITPDPTWAVASFRLAPEPGDNVDTTRTVWEVWVPAGNLALQLPVLAPSAPPGLPDPLQTPANDRLLWDLWESDPAGSIGQVMQNPFSTLTRWTQRTIEVASPFSAVEEVGLGTASLRTLRFRLTPNPGRPSATSSGTARCRSDRR